MVKFTMLGVGYHARDPKRTYGYYTQVIVNPTDDKILCLGEGQGAVGAGGAFRLEDILDPMWDEHLQLTNCEWLRDFARRNPDATPAEVLAARPG